MSRTLPPADPAATASDVRAVAFATPAGLSLGGVTIWSLEMARRLRAAGQRGVLLNHPRPDLPELPPAVADGLEVLPGFSILRPGRFRDNVELYRRALPATLIPNWSAETYGICARLSRSRAAAMRVIGYCHADEGFYYRFLRYYEPLIHRFVAVSEECGRKLRELLPGRAEDVVVRPYAVAEPRRSDREYAAAGAPLRLLYAGRIEQGQKRVYDLLGLARALAERGIPFRLRIVGDGPARDGLCARLRRLDPAVRRHALVEGGVPPDGMPALLRASDVCLLTSAFEGTSLFMLEGMAHGCVPVVTRVSGTAGVIDEGVDGHTRAVGDLAGMADVLAALARDRGRLAAMGARAALKAQRYSYEVYLPWFLSLIDAAWRDPPRVWPVSRPFVPGMNSLLRRGAEVLPLLRKAREWFPQLG